MRKYLLFLLTIVSSSFTSAQQVLHLQNGASITIQNGGEVTLMGGIGFDNGSSLVNNGTLWLKNNPIANQADWTDNSAMGALSGTGLVIFNSTHIQNFAGATQFYNVRIDAAGLSLQNDFSISNTLQLAKGAVNTGSYYILLNNANTSSLLNDASNAAYANSWINGNFRRLIASNTSVYEFPVGNSARCNLLQFFNNNISGINYLTASFGPKLGNDEGLNVVENSAMYAAVNNGGVWYLVPDSSPSSGNYALQLYFNGFNGLADNRFGILRRDDVSSTAADWTVPTGSSLEADDGLGRKLSDGFARRKDISTFSQWGIGEMQPASVPTVTIDQASAQGDPTTLSPIHFTVTFSENVAGFDASDVSLVSSTVGEPLSVSVTGGPSVYDVAVTGMASSGLVRATVPAGAAVNAASLSSLASTSTDNTVEFEGTAPPTLLTVTIGQANGQGDPTSSSPINFTVEFSEPVVDFANGDVSLSGTAGATTTVVTGSGTTYNVAVSGMTQSGTVSATIPANAAHKADATGNTASTSIDNTVTFDLSPPPIGNPVINISDATVYESEGMAVLTISLSHITALEVKISYNTADGTAAATKKDKDYKSVGNKGVTISPGTLSTTIAIPVYNDGKTESNEYFYVNLIKPTNCTLGDVTGLVTILDGGTSPSARVAAGVETEDISEEETALWFDVIAYPNPSYSDFMLEIISADEVPAKVRVFSTAYQVIEKITLIDTSVRVGQEWKAGIYFVEVVQGLKRKTIKLIKY